MQHKPEMLKKDVDHYLSEGVGEDFVTWIIYKDGTKEKWDCTIHGHINGCHCHYPLTMDACWRCGKVFDADPNAKYSDAPMEIELSKEEVDRRYKEWHDAVPPFVNGYRDVYMVLNSEIVTIPVVTISERGTWGHTLVSETGEDPWEFCKRIYGKAPLSMFHFKDQAEKEALEERTKK
jgi:hypothetical protein